MPLYNHMEDAAMAEICRAQTWQWLHHRAPLDDGRLVTRSLVKELFADEMAKLRETLSTDALDTGKFAEASDLFVSMSLNDECPEFLTLPAYRLLD